MPPAQPGPLREDWITRAGHAGFYRQAAHITDPNVAIGPRPEADPEKAAAWDHAARALNLDTAEHGTRAASRAQLERDVHAYAQAAEAAPPDMGRQIDQHRRPPPNSRGTPSSTRPPAATRTPPSPAPPPPGKPGSPTGSSPPTRPAPDGNATTNPSGWPPAPPARNSTAAASSPHPNPASPTPKPPTTGSRTPPSRPSPAPASRAASAHGGSSSPPRPTRPKPPSPPSARPPPKPDSPGHPARRTCGPAAEPRTTLQWQPEAGPDTAHVDPAWWAQIKAEQTARVQIAKAARRETAARAVPVTDAEIALYGTRHQDAGYAHPAGVPGVPEPAADTEREPLLAAPTEHHDPSAHETSSQYYARMQSYARWQPESHPEATAGPTAAPEAHPAEPDLEP